MKVGPVINDQATRARRIFPSYGYPLLRVILKDKFEPNALSSRTHDNWTGTFSLINLMKGDTKEPISMFIIIYPFICLFVFFVFVLSLIFPLSFLII
jgi:hypothetical protein